MDRVLSGLVYNGQEGVLRVKNVKEERESGLATESCEGIENL